jgi:hypothetical protein
MARPSRPIQPSPERSEADAVSYNFHLAKAVAIFAVIVGHFAQVLHHPAASVLWIPTEIGLFTFAFSSGYFTGKKYQGDFSIRAFWQAKISRLIGPLLVADAFLICLLVVQGKEDVFHWHSSLACFGLSGVLMWLGITSLTPLGVGLWFLTLLWVFYLTFPALERLNRQRISGATVLIAGLAACLILVHRVPYGVAFWETAWFFMLGTYCGRHLERISLAISVPLALVCGCGIPISKFVLQIPWALTPLMIGLGVGVVGMLPAIRLPRWGATIVFAISGAMLEIYVIHTYLFIRGHSGSIALDFGLSLILILVMAGILSPAGAALGRSLNLRLRS